MRAFRQHRIVPARHGAPVVSLNKREIGRRCLHQLRRREVAGIAGMEGGAVVRLVGKLNARAELVGVDKLPHLVEAQAGIDRQIVGDLPFVLDIDAGEPAEFRDIVGDRIRRSVVGAVADDAGLDQRRIADKGLLAADRRSRREGMRRIDR